MKTKYSVNETGPRIEQFLHQVIAHAGFELTFALEPGDQTNPDFENPDLTVKFRGPDVEMLRMHSDDHSRISFDANDYRAIRIEELRVSALAAADKVKHTGTLFRFNAMNSRERRVIHIALRNEHEVRSESAGAGPQRGVVIYPASMASIPDLPPLPAPSHHAPGSGDRPRFGGGGGRGGDRRPGPGGRDRRPGGGRPDGRGGGRPPFNRSGNR